MPALVCPLVLAQAAEIEALPAGQFLIDPTKLANGLRALHGAFGTDVIVTAAADDLAACSLAECSPAAAGAGAAGAASAAGDLAAAVTGHPRVAAAVEATRRLAAPRTPCWPPPCAGPRSSPHSSAARTPVPPRWTSTAQCYWPWPRRSWRPGPICCW
jgi:hypothetical protein